MKLKKFTDFLTEETTARDRTSVGIRIRREIARHSRRPKNRKNQDVTLYVINLDPKTKLSVKSLELK